MDKKTIIFSLIIVILLAMTIINYQKRTVAERSTVNAAQEQEKAKKIVEQVKKLLFLDDEKNPTVAAIVDIEKLRAQSPFYAHAENGDYVIVTSKKAIIYSPSKNKIIDVVPIELKPKGEQGKVTESRK